MITRFKKRSLTGLIISILIVVIAGIGAYIFFILQNRGLKKITDSRERSVILEEIIAEQYKSLEIFENYIVTGEKDKISNLKLTEREQILRLKKLKALIQSGSDSYQSAEILRNSIQKTFSYFDGIITVNGRKRIAADLLLQIIATARSSTAGIELNANKIIISENINFNEKAENKENILLLEILFLILGIAGSILSLIFFFEVRKENNSFKNKEESLKILSHAVKRINECIIISDNNNIIYYVNDACRQLYNYVDDDLLGKNIMQLFSKRISRQLLEKTFEQIIQNGWCGEVLQNKKDGSEIAVQFSASPIKDNTGNTIAVITVVSDVSQRKAAEEETKRYIEELQVNKDLLEQNAEELLELNVKLYESEQKLKEIDINRDKMYSVISHDLRSPFNSLVGLSDILANDIENLSQEEIKHFSLNIYKASKKALALVDQLLLWSRLQAGKYNLSTQEINLSDLLENIISEFSSDSILPKAIIHEYFEGGLKVIADFGILNSSIKHIIKNILMNNCEGGNIIISGKETGSFIEIRIKEGSVFDEEADSLSLSVGDSVPENTGAKEKYDLEMILFKEMIEKIGGQFKIDLREGSAPTIVFSVPKVSHSMELLTLR